MLIIFFVLCHCPHSIPNRHKDNEEFTEEKLKIVIIKIIRSIIKQRLSKARMCDIHSAFSELLSHMNSSDVCMRYSKSLNIKFMKVNESPPEGVRRLFSSGLPSHFLSLLRDLTNHSLVVFCFVVFRCCCLSPFPIADKTSHHKTTSLNYRGKRGTTGF